MSATPAHIKWMRCISIRRGVVGAARGCMSDNKLKSVETAIKSIQEIIVIISGFAFVMAITQFFTINGMIPKEYSQLILSPISSFIFLLIMINIVRFCYGNLRHLDESFLIKEEKIKGIDYIFPLIECLIFCILSLYQSIPAYFFGLFTALLLVDCFWIFKNWAWERLSSEREFKHQRNWFINNIITSFLLICLLIAYHLTSNSFRIYLIVAMLGMLYLNTFVDFLQNWEDLYFPKRVESEV